ncbi:MAG: hypothetical protein ACO1OB_18560 [Archangium sp.]
MRGWVLLLLFTSCASGFTSTLHEPSTPITVSAVVIPPVRMLGAGEASWHRFELGQRQVDVALRLMGDRLAVVGPAQVQISRWDEPGWLGTNALPVLTRAGLPPSEALVLRATAEQRVTSGTMEREDSKGLAKGGRATHETTWLVTVELIHPGNREALAEFSGQVTVDPFAAPTGEEEFDPDWPMTRLLEKLTREALSAAKEDLGDRPAVNDSGLTLALSPAFTAAHPDASSAQTDALQAEVWMQARARFLSPWLDEGTAAKLARMPPVLFVYAAPGNASLRPGDMILSIDGQPPLPEVLARKRLTGVPVEVRVGRDGNERDEVIP